MQSVDLLTYDVWDTLLRRKCHPDEVKRHTSRILLLQKSVDLKKDCMTVGALCAARLDAEILLGNRAKTQGYDDEYEIADVFATWLAMVLKTENAPEEVTSWLVDVELEFEKEVTYLDSEIVELLDSFQARKLMFVSDFYMPANMLKKLLLSSGLDEKYCDGLSSCDKGYNKRSGRLYELIKEEVGQVKSWIHIGDNHHSDVMMAEKAGARGLHFLGGVEGAERLKIESAFRARKNGDLRPYLQFLEPVEGCDAPGPVGSRHALIFYAFVLSIIEHAKMKGLDKVYYFTREGEFLQKIHKEIVRSSPFGLSMPESELLEVSRMATFSPSLTDFSVQSLRRFWTMYSRHSMKTLFLSLNIDSNDYVSFLKRYDLELDEVLEHPWKDGRFLRLIADADFTDKIESELAVKRSLLKEYFKQKGVEDTSGKEILVVDIGWRGTIQDNVARVLSKLHVSGFYFGLLDYLNEQPLNTSKASFGPNVNIGESSSWLFSCQAPLEMLFNSPSGSVSGYKYKKDGTVEATRVSDESEDRVYRTFTENYQRGVLSQIQNISGWVKKYSLVSADLKPLAMSLLEQLTVRPDRCVAQAYFSLNHNETFGNGVFVSKKLRISATQIVRALVFSSVRAEMRKTIEGSGWSDAYWQLSGQSKVLRLILDRKLVSRYLMSKLGLSKAYRRVTALRFSIGWLRKQMKHNGLQRLPHVLSQYDDSFGVAPKPERQIPEVLKLVYSVDIESVEGRNFNKLQSSLRKFDPRKPLTINWIIPDIGLGSGGHTTIMRFVRFFETSGFINRIYTVYPSEHGTNQGLRDFVNAHYIQTKNVEFISGSESVGESDITIATSWDTAYRVFNIQNTKFKAYFIQDFEPSFFPVGAYHQFAKSTYELGFYGICASKWLNAIANNYGMEACYFNLGFDKGKYKIDDYTQRNRDQIAVYIRPHTERRGLELIIGALSILKRQRPQTKIVFFGNDRLTYSGIDFDYTVAGLLSEEQLSELYNKSAICLLTSFTNYSLLPIEIMACGALVVDVEVDSMTAVFDPKDPIVLAKPHPHAMARALTKYLDFPAKREEITQRASEYIHQFEWERVFHGVQSDLLSAYYKDEELSQLSVLGEGQVVRPENGDRIYVYRSGRKCYIPSLEVAVLHGISLDDVTSVPANCLALVPNGYVLD